MRIPVVLAVLGAAAFADPVDVFTGNIVAGARQMLNNGHPLDALRANPDGRGRQTLRGVNLGLDSSCTTAAS